MQHFHTKPFCQKPILKQTEWEVQNGPIRMNGVLLVTPILIWRTNHSNIHTFRKRWIFSLCMSLSLNMLPMLILRDKSICKLLNIIFKSCLTQRIFPSSTQLPNYVPLWSYFGRDVADHNRTKIGRLRFLTYFSSAMSDMQLASGNIEKCP